MLYTNLWTILLCCIAQITFIYNFLDAKYNIYLLMIYVWCICFMEMNGSMNEVQTHAFLQTSYPTTGVLYIA